MTDLDLDPAELDRRARDMLRRFPLIDGHNDLPWALRDRARQHGQDASQVVFDLEAPAGGLHTDLPRLAAGGIGRSSGPSMCRPRWPVTALSRPCSSRSTWPAG